ASPPEAVGGEPVVAEGEPALLAVLPPLLAPLEQERLGLGEPPLQRAEHAEVLERDGLPAEVAHLALEPERLLAQRPGLLGLPQLDVGVAEVAQRRRQPARVAAVAAGADDLVEEAEGGLHVAGLRGHDAGGVADGHPGGGGGAPLAPGDELAEAAVAFAEVAADDPEPPQRLPQLERGLEVVPAFEVGEG